MRKFILLLVLTAVSLTGYYLPSSAQTGHEGVLIFSSASTLYISESGEISTLAEDVIPSQVFVSPDKETVLYVESTGGVQSLRAYNVSNNTNTTLHTVANEIVGIAWNADSQIVALLETGETSPMQLVLSTVDDPEHITIDVIVQSMVWLTDNRLLIVSIDVEKGVSRPQVVDLAGDVHDIATAQLTPELLNGMGQLAHWHSVDAILRNLDLNLALPVNENYLDGVLDTEANAFATVIYESVDPESNCSEISIMYQPFRESFTPSLLYRIEAMGISGLYWTINETLFFAESTSSTCEWENINMSIKKVDLGGNTEIVVDQIDPNYPAYVVSPAGDNIAYIDSETHSLVVKHIATGSQEILFDEEVSIVHVWLNASTVD